MTVKKNGIALKYINNQTEEICTHTVNQIGLSLTFVNDKTDEQCVIAIRIDQNAEYFGTK